MSTIKVTIREGDTLRVEFDDCDGGFDISYGDVVKKALTISTDFADSTSRGEVTEENPLGLIYQEDYGQDVMAMLLSAMAPN